ncbi:MAG: hypothetical protein LJE68_13055 [Rhodobacter sp.]|nr:hypothetical protein [Rhodobacter sp.]
MADTFDTLDRWDSEGNALDTTIKLYNFGRQIAKDIHAVAQDDISLTMLGNSTLFASEFAEENPQKVTWTNLKTVHVKGKLAYSVPGFGAIRGLG